jgi:hypothetical protein
MIGVQERLRLLEMAVKIVDDRTYARHRSIEEQWERRTEERPYPDLPVVDTNEVEEVYNKLLGCVE